MIDRSRSPYLTSKQVIQIVESAHAELARFARESYAIHGRGATRLDVPAMPTAAAIAFVATEMVYQTLEDLRAVLADIDSGDAREAADILLRMIETYDPASQAVLVVGIAGQNPVSLKMKLVQPVIADEPGGVH